MKKFLLLIFSLISILSAKAQYDETKLLGKWDIVTQNGTMSNSILSCTGFYFGNIALDDDYYTKFGVGALFQVEIQDYHEIRNHCLSDFFISNNDKLHITIIKPDSGVNPTLQFKINKFTDNELKLTSFDGQCTLELRKDTTGMNQVREESEDNEHEVYGLDGLPIHSSTSRIAVSPKGKVLK